MHKLVVACGMACLLFGVSAAQAQDYDDDTRPAPDMRHIEKREPVRKPTVSTEFLRLQRAMKRAEERRARIEARKWNGVSIQRPFFVAGQVNRTFNGVQIWPTIPFHRQLP